MKTSWKVHDKYFSGLLCAAVFALGAASAETPPLPRFSVERGFYREPFTLTITTTGNSAAIRYTVDGSDPRYSEHGKLASSPLTLFVDPEDTTGRDTAPGFIVRAASCGSDTLFSAAVTHTYLFVEKAGQLSPDGRRPGPQWPEPYGTNQRMDYGLDPEVLNDPRYRNKMTEALVSLPTVSLVTDLKNLFDRKTGIYVNALQHGDEWERPASVELMIPDGNGGFQIDAGLRIRGGYSRHGNYPKHAFRLFFREEYGEAKLQYPMFEDEGAAEFDKLDLRTPQNYAWSNVDVQGVFHIMVRDVYSRDLQRDMGQPYTRSRFYHLYLDGTYWGLFQSQERPEARYAASYLGGSPEDYDVVKVATDASYIIEATDGTLDSWQTVWDLCQQGFSSRDNYCRLLGLGADGERDYNLVKWIDLDNLIDYMLIIFQTGDFDAPVSKFNQPNKNPNNFYAVFNCNNPDGFKFFVHDAEHSLFTSPYADPGIGLYENRVNIGDLTDGYRMTVSGFNKFHPQWLHHLLTQNGDYRMRFADRTYRHFFNEGAIIPEANIRRLMSRVEEIDMAIIAESARWGDAQARTPRTKHDDWLPQVDNVVDNFFPFRNAIVLDQLKEAGLYPHLEPPRFMQNGRDLTALSVQVESGFKLALINPNAAGTVYITTDGTDPRLMGGSPSSHATAGDTQAVEILSTSRVKARVLDGNTWSALHEITLSVRDDLSGLKVTEIHYHPLDSEPIDGREFEFLELKNTGVGALNLTDAFFTNGISYTFPAETLLESGRFIVLASNRQQFNNRYYYYPFGEYTGQLDNNGERIVLLNAAGDMVLNIRYNDKSPWPVEPDNLGFSLVPKETNPTGDPNDAANWRASHYVNGSPGRDDDGTVSVRNQERSPTDHALCQNYPNPFNPETTISYSLSGPEKVSLTVYNASGRKIRTLLESVQTPGRHEIVWDSRDESGRNVPSGIYFCRIQCRSFSKTLKMVLMR